MTSILCAPALWLQAGGSAGSGQEYLLAVLGISILSLVVAAGLAKYIISQDTGTPQMQKISNAIKQGAEAFLRRQNKTILGSGPDSGRHHLPRLLARQGRQRWPFE